MMKKIGVFLCPTVYVDFSVLGVKTKYWQLYYKITKNWANAHEMHESL